jgi:hypothetical protein
MHIEPSASARSTERLGWDLPGIRRLLLLLLLLLLVRGERVPGADRIP